MSITIGLISDVHATAAPLLEALKLFERHGVGSILCAGDMAGYGTELVQTVALLEGADCNAVMGNHDLWCMDRGQGKEGAGLPFIEKLPLRLERKIAGKRLYMVHACPPQSLMDGIALLDDQGSVLPDRMSRWTELLSGADFDLLVVGHTHQVFAEVLGRVLVINPGSTKFNHSCAILTLPEMTVRFFSLSNQEIRHSWHWGMMPQNR